MGEEGTMSPTTKPATAPALVEEATAPVDTMISFEFRGATYQTRLRPTVKTIRFITAQDFPAAVESMLGPDQAAEFWARHDDDDAMEIFQEWFDLLGERMGGNS